MLMSRDTRVMQIHDTPNLAVCITPCKQTFFFFLFLMVALCAVHVLIFFSLSKPLVSCRSFARRSYSSLSTIQQGHVARAKDADVLREDELYFKRVS